MENVTLSLLLIRKGLKSYAIFFLNLFFWINLAYKYAEVCICFANHKSLSEVWTGSSAFCFVVIWRCRSRVMEWSDKAVFCLLFIFFDKTSSAVTNISWYFLSSLISKRKSLSIAAVNLLNNFSFFLPFGGKGYFKATYNYTRRCTRHDLFHANWHALVKRWGCCFVWFFFFFFFWKKLIINNTLKQTNNNYARGFPVIISFMRTNTWSGFSKIQLATRPVNTFQEPV